ncbi:unnamed protein product [Auanema sp. JU1783]|nr:unnamed protein product [Auanema sp. JU1783]
MTNLPVDEPELVEILKGLSCEEQAIIRPVLERDLEFQRREKERLQKLRTNLDLEKSTISNCHGSAYSITTSESQESMASSNISSSASPSSPSRACCRCSAKLGFILNAGSKCKKCQQLVCDSCRVVPLESKKAVYCSLCFKERELQAASREWLQNTGDDVSQHLLFQMKRANRERSNSAKPGPAPLRNSHHAPPISRRNMTLPSLETMTTLAVPSEDEAIGRQLRGDITKRFWGGSPSPRSPSPRPGSTGLSTIASSPPHSANSLLAELHPREIIGSPSPRSSSANAFGRNPFNSPSISPLPTAEIAPPTPTNITHSPIAEHRRHVFTTKRYPGQRRQSELPVPTFSLSMC